METVSPTNLIDNSESIAVDVGCGHGWFSIADVLCGGKGSIAADLDEERLKVAREITRIFSIQDRIDFIVSPIEEMPLPKNCVDIFVSVETLEHVGKQKIQPVLLRIKDITSKIFLITTPNKLFPVIAHDTRLPFVHWLPPGRRKAISRFFGRQSCDRGNEFLSPFDLNIFFDKFKPVSSYLSFQSFQDYIEHFPVYVPYGRDESMRIQTNPPKVKASYYKLANYLLHKYSYFIMPTLTSIFMKRSLFK